MTFVINEKYSVVTLILIYSDDMRHEKSADNDSLQLAIRLSQQEDNPWRENREKLDQMLVEYNRLNSRCYRRPLDVPPDGNSFFNCLAYYVIHRRGFRGNITSEANWSLFYNHSVFRRLYQKYLALHFNEDKLLQKFIAKDIYPNEPTNSRLEEYVAEFGNEGTSTNLLVAMRLMNMYGRCAVECFVVTGSTLSPMKPAGIDKDLDELLEMQKIFCGPQRPTLSIILFKDHYEWIIELSTKEVFHYSLFCLFFQ